ncbi:MAG: hypothetical protein AAGC93_28930 [Cyanobacteria bacterium P01_F01_bin.53]
MTKNIPIKLLVVGISLSTISLCTRSPVPTTTHTDNFTPTVPARAIVIDPATQAVTLEASSSD